MEQNKQYIDLKSFLQECQANKRNLEKSIKKYNQDPFIKITAHRVLVDVEKLINYIENH